MLTLLLLVIIIPIAAVVGAWIGVSAARKDFPQLRKVPTLYLMALPLIPAKKRSLSRWLTPELPKAAPLVSYASKRSSDGHLVPVYPEYPDTIIRTLDTVTGQESVWCQYPIADVEEAVLNLNQYYGGQKLFWRQGDIRPDIAQARAEQAARQAARARYITRPLTQRGVPIYENSYPPRVIAVAPDRAAALELQERLMRENGISTTVPGMGA